MENTQNRVIEPKASLFKSIRRFLIDNIVMIIFLLICVGGVIIADQSAVYLISQLLERISRNTFLVLALIIPVVAGMGLNFSIIIGAMAGQVAIIFAKNFNIGGLPGMILVMALCVPLSILFGIMIGRLLNKTRGQEMIASMIVGFFANGLYQLVFLVLVGLIIPIANKDILLQSGIGLRNSVEMAGKVPVNNSGLTADGLKYAIDGLWKAQIFDIILVFGLVMLIINLMVYFRKQIIQALKLKSDSWLVLMLEPANPLSKQQSFIRIGIYTLLAAGLYAIQFIGIGSYELRTIGALQFPIVTGVLIILLALFNVVILRTKLGQDFRSVGQDQHVAKVSGIDVDKVRIIAITLSTILAAWGQVILLQNVGVLNTFGSHMQIGMFSVAALLVGGASVTRATNAQAFIGVILFHTLFIVSPTAGKNLFGDPQLGEFFRAFVAYGVIGLSLGLYAWKRAMGKA